MNGREILTPTVRRGHVITGQWASAGRFPGSTGRSPMGAQEGHGGTVRASGREKR